MSNPTLYSLTVSWATPFDDGGFSIDSYDIFRSTDTERPAEAVHNVDPSTLEWVNADLSRNTQYFYWVQAVTSFGRSDASDFATGKTLVEPPGIPPFKCDPLPSGTEVDCTWTEPENGGAEITRYCMYVAPDSTMPEKPYECYDSTVTDKEWKMLKKNTDYCYWLTVENAARLSVVVGPECITTPGTNPGRIQGVSVTDPTLNTLTVSWFAPWDNGGFAIDSYSVYKSTDTAVPAEPAMSVGGDALTWLSDELSRNTNYFYWVKAVTAFGSSQISRIASGKTLVEPPTEPTFSCVGLESGTEVDCNWVAPTDDGGAPITQYCIYRNEGSTMPDYPYECYDSEIVVKEWDWLKKNQEYCFWLTAENAAGLKVTAGPICTTTPATAPSAAIGIVVYDPQLYSLTVDWRAPNDDGGMPIDTYNIFRGTTKDRPEEAANSVGSDIFSWLNDGLDRNTRYFYWVQAQTAFGVSPTSYFGSGRTLVEEPTAPGFDCVARESGTEIDCTWTEPEDNGGADMTQYCLYKNDVDTMPEQPWECYDASVLVKEWDWLNKNKQYCYWLTAENEARKSVLVGPVCITTPGTPPSAVSSIYVNNPQLHSLTVNWATPFDDGGYPITDFNIFRSLDVNTPSESVMNVAGTEVTWVNDGLDRNTQYFYWVQAVTSFGVSDMSDFGSGRTLFELVDMTDV